jgi:hypothetical protein
MKDKQEIIQFFNNITIKESSRNVESQTKRVKQKYLGR